MKPTLWQPPPPLSLERPRPRVTAALSAAASAPLVLVQAAVGYGKTVAAREFWHSLPEPKAWWSATLAQHSDCPWWRAASQAWGLPAEVTPSSADLSAALAAAPGGWLVLDDLQHLPALSWPLLAQQLAQLPAHCHVLLLCRAAPPLPVTWWLSQDRLRRLDGTLLALTAEEAASAGLPPALSQHLGGWWGAVRAAALTPEADWNANLALWLDQAWLSTLSPEQQQHWGLWSLLPECSAEQLAALAGWDAPRAAAAWAEASLQSGPPWVLQAKHRGLAPAYRLYVQQIWRRHDPQAWAQSLQRGLQHLLQQGADGRAAELALDSGWPEACQRVLQEAGWRLLFGPDRARLAALLEQAALAPTPPAATAHADASTAEPPAPLEAQALLLLQYAWQIEGQKAPHRADAALNQLRPHLAPALQGQAWALSASMAWQYDDVVQAEADARRALQCLPHEQHPAHCWAQLTLALARAGQGYWEEAEALLCRAHASATRDALPLLQLECLQRRAWVANERGCSDLALSLAHSAASLAAELGPAAASIRDSNHRLRLSLHLQALALDQAAALLAEPNQDVPDPRCLEARRVLQATLDLLQHRVRRAQSQAEQWQRQQEQTFFPQKWQADMAQLQLWLAAAQADHARLQDLATAWAAWAPANTGPTLWHQDRRRVLLAAARLLAQQEDDHAALQALGQRLTQQGALLLARRLRLVLLLRQSPFDRAAGLSLLRECASHNQALDWIWLGSLTVAPLESLLHAPELMHDARTLQFVRRLVQQLLRPHPDTHTATEAETTASPNADPTPPAGLTSKEWQILQLIGQQHSNEQIAARLFVSLATVKTHINHLYAKLKIKTRAEAIYLARSLGR